MHLSSLILITLFSSSQLKRNDPKSVKTKFCFVAKFFYSDPKKCWQQKRNIYSNEYFICGALSCKLRLYGRMLQKLMCRESINAYIHLHILLLYRHKGKKYSALLNHKFQLCSIIWVINFIIFLLSNICCQQHDWSWYHAPSAQAWLVTGPTDSTKL